MAEGFLIDVRDTALDVNEALQAVRHPSQGGAVLFVGMVRDHSDGKSVTRLEYEAYGSMARLEMRRIAEEIAGEQPGVLLAAIHRVGSLAIGDLAIVCAASAPHRQQAFNACESLINRIKERVPVWKREHGQDGSVWVGWSGPAEGDPPGP